jgi:proteasome assembly chaperone (PAC2) family protein
MEEEIKIGKEVHPDKAIMIIGLSGWGNAGEVSTFTVKYLVDKLEAKKFAEIQHDKFHDYWIQRPIVLTQKGLIKSYVPPRNDLFYWGNKGGGFDLILMIGFEPHLNWPKYTGNILRLAKEMNVKRIYTLGGYLADIPQGVETPVTSSTNNRRLLPELKKAGFELTDYEGPTSVYSELLWKGRDMKVDVVSLWCVVPIYIKGMYPKASYVTLNKILSLIGLKLDLADLKEKTESFKVEIETESAERLQPSEAADAQKGRQEKQPTYFG